MWNIDIVSMGRKYFVGFCKTNIEKDMWTIVMVNDDQQDANVLVYLFIPNQLYMFLVMSSPIIRSTCLYLQHLIMFNGIAAGCCHG